MMKRNIEKRMADFDKLVGRNIRRDLTTGDIQQIVDMSRVPAEAAFIAWKTAYATGYRHALIDSRKRRGERENAGRAE